MKVARDYMILLVSRGHTLTRFGRGLATRSDTTNDNTDGHTLQDAYKMSIQPEGVDASIAHSSTRECWLDLASGYNGTESKKHILNFGE